MRIGMMADAYKPHISGVTNHIALNKIFMEAKGHEVFIFTFGDVDYEDDEPHVVRSSGLPVVDTGFYINVRYNKEARRQLRTMDVVHVHHPFVSGTLALRYCKPYGIPIVFTNHTRYDLYYQAYLPMLPEGLGDTFLHTYLPSFCRACDLVIAPSKGMREVLLSFGVTSPVEVTPNGVDLQPIHTIKGAVDRSEFGFSEEDIVLLFVGRLGPEKNLPFLLRSFAGTAEAIDNIRLLIIGGGPERENLEDRVQHMGLGSLVKFAGLVPYEKMPGYLVMADIFVTASVTEVHPLTVIEAMAAGLPVLGIQSPGVGDTVLDGETGFLASNDLAAFTAKMVRLVTEHERRREFGLRARQASEQYAIERTSQILLGQYQNLIAQNVKRNRGLQGALIGLLEKFRR
jgi:glycosyltransferase involved in cell wall biosynthesis